MWNRSRNHGITHGSVGHQKKSPTVSIRGQAVRRCYKGQARRRARTRRTDMKVIVFVKATKNSEAGVMPSQQLMEDMGKYNDELIKAGIMQAGEGLKPSSNAKRIRFSGNQRTVVDGPFAETKELVAGFWIWQVKNLEEAVEWARRCPAPM